MRYVYKSVCYASYVWSLEASYVQVMCWLIVRCGLVGRSKIRGPVDQDNC